MLNISASRSTICADGWRSSASIFFNATVEQIICAASWCCVNPSPLRWRFNHSPKDTSANLALSINKSIPFVSFRDTCSKLLRCKVLLLREVYHLKEIKMKNKELLLGMRVLLLLSLTLSAVLPAQVSALAASASPGQPTFVTNIVDETQYFAFTSAICGFPVFEHDMGTVTTLITTLPDGSV